MTSNSYGVCLVKLSTESVGSRRKVVANSVRTADADADAICVGDVYWALRAQSKYCFLYRNILWTI